MTRALFNSYVAATRRIVALASVLAFASCAHAAPDADEAHRNARALGETFARGFYEVDPPTAISVLHPALSKLGVIPNIRNSGRSALLRLTPGTLEVFASAHNRDAHINPATAVTQIDILDARPDVAVFRLVADKDWFDYWIAARIGDEWRLVNCVFGGYQQIENQTLTEDRAAILEASRSLGVALADANFKGVHNAIHLDFERRSVQATGTDYRLVPETLESLQQDLARSTREPPPNMVFLGATQVSAAVRLDFQNRTEWVFLLKLDGAWRPVNSFWSAKG